MFYKPLYESKSREIQVKNCIENSCFEISCTGEVPRLDSDLEELTWNKIVRIRYFVSFETFKFTRIITSELDLSELSPEATEEFLRAKSSQMEALLNINPEELAH